MHRPKAVFDTFTFVIYVYGVFIFRKYSFTTGVSTCSTRSTLGIKERNQGTAQPCRWSHTVRAYNRHRLLQRIRTRAPFTQPMLATATMSSTMAKNPFGILKGDPRTVHHAPAAYATRQSIRASTQCPAKQSTRAPIPPTAA